MNAIRRITNPCPTVEEWLAHNAATKCPNGYALGLSALEVQTGIIARTQTWRERAKNQSANEVAAAKQKRLQSHKKYRK